MRELGEHRNFNCLGYCWNSCLFSLNALEERDIKWVWITLAEASDISLSSKSWALKTLSFLKVNSSSAVWEIVSGFLQQYYKSG